MNHFCFTLCFDVATLYLMSNEPTKEEKLKNIDEVLESGAKRVKYEDREVEYRSVSELESIRRRVARRGKRSKRAITPAFDKGL